MYGGLKDGVGEGIWTSLIDDIAQMVGCESAAELEATLGLDGRIFQGSTAGRLEGAAAMDSDHIE